MSCSWRVQSFLVVLLNILHIVWSVPPHQCLVPFNHSDCNLPPRLVFAYYKPGSRCELEVWRGCPTLNKFNNQYQCELNCIFRDPNINECEIQLNTKVCSKETQIVYTHENGRCVEANWGGCRTYNKFGSKAECEEKCNVVYKEAPQESEKELKLLQDINTILESIINKTDTTTEPIEPTTTTEPTDTTVTTEPTETTETTETTNTTEHMETSTDTDVTSI